MYFRTNKMSIYYEKHGNKNQSIIILPGWGDTRKTFDNIVNYFKSNYEIYIFDYPGWGNSKIPKDPLTIYDYAETIKKFIIKNKINNPIIIAHSFGGRIASLLETHYNIKIDKMILIDIAGIKPKKTIKKYIKEKIYKLLKKVFQNNEKVKKKLFSIFASSDYQELPKGMHKTFINIINEDLTKYFKQIHSECLLIWGKLDTATPLKDGYKINKLIKNSAIIIYPKGNHFPYIQYPEQTNKIIECFIKN